MKASDLLMTSNQTSARPGVGLKATAASWLEGILFRKDGKMTDELRQIAGPDGLGRVPAALAPDSLTSMVCGFCSTGCALDIHLSGGRAINLSPDPRYPVNLGMACPKGWEALSPLDAPDRGTTPLRRSSDGTMVPCGWDEAMKEFVGRVKSIQAEHGAESVAWLGTGQMPTEELAFLGALGKFGLGFIHGDGNTRQCMATSVMAYKECFGFDSPPFTYSDFEASDVLVFIGANPCIAHPIMWQRVMRNRHDPDVLVIDPRRTETAVAASRHCALKPKSDLALLLSIAYLLIRWGATDADFIHRHTTGFEAFARHVADYPPEAVMESTGLTYEDIEDLARRIARGKRVSFWWTMGVNQSHQATRTAQAIIALALMTGNIGRPGTGANSITGQCNAMGSRLFSNTTNLLGGRDFTNATHREEVASILGLPVTRIPSQGSLAYDQILEAVRSGKIKALWIIATNPAHSWIQQEGFHELREKLEFLVVQDMYHSTETARMADLYLPAAGWGEKEGTFINSERRIGGIKKVRVPPGLALPDFDIFKLVAHFAGCADLFSAWSSPEAVFRILTRLSEGRPCDISGITGYEMLDKEGGIQWPLSAMDARDGFESERRLFGDGKFFTPDGRARFVCEAPRPVPELVCAEYPFTLLTGRGSSAQWHTGSRTDKSAVLKKLHPSEPYVEIHPMDATALGVVPEAMVLVSSRRGTMAARARITDTVPVGTVFIPMHFGDCNKLTSAEFDPISRQPAYKACAVRVSPREGAS